MSEYPEPVPGRIAVVGPCGAGKSELVRRLRAQSIDARQCGQEHSLVPDMWRWISRPQVLIYLDAPDGVLEKRRGVPADPAYAAEQRRRLERARAGCHLYLDTGALSREQVAERVLAALAELDPGVKGLPGSGPEEGPPV
ncbi:MAG: hypothetical protein GXX94_02770 [Chloroflexi bacterium]|nr:hypothetical protein [Chloroflexota bacterium]